MEEDLRARLLATSAVTALCGQRIDWGSNPQGSGYPRICMWVISDSEDHTLDGPDGVSFGRVQVDCFGATYGQAKALARAARVSLDGYRGGRLQAVFLVGTRDFREGGTNEAERPFRTSLDFNTTYTST
jgi:hypothetical protein